MGRAGSIPARGTMPMRTLVITQTTQAVIQARQPPHPLHHAKKKPRSSGAETGCLEARAGVEPTYTDLQSGA